MFIIGNKSGTKFVKFTCRFGPFHGDIRLTNIKQEARIWTNKIAAERTIRVMESRRFMYNEDSKLLGKSKFRVFSLRKVSK